MGTIDKLPTQLGELSHYKSFHAQGLFEWDRFSCKYKCRIKAETYILKVSAHPVVDEFATREIRAIRELEKHPPGLSTGILKIAEAFLGRRPAIVLPNYSCTLKEYLQVTSIGNEELYQSLATFLYTVEEYMWRKQYVHANISLSSIVVCEKEFFLTDFLFAFPKNELPKYLLKTVYSAPEYLLDLEYGYTDWWSMGCVLSEISGETLLEECTTLEALLERQQQYFGPFPDAWQEQIRQMGLTVQVPPDQSNGEGCEENGLCSYDWEGRLGGFTSSVPSTRSSEYGDAVPWLEEEEDISL